MTDKPVAKSLHTLTVIQQVARLQMPTSGHSLAGMAEDGIDRAMTTLGLANRPDPYGLRDRALALLIAAVSKEAAQ